MSKIEGVMADNQMIRRESWIEGVIAANQMIRRAIDGATLVLAISADSDRIFDQVDSFVVQSQGNDTIQRVDLFPYDVDPGNYEHWDKVGQGVGNLKSLRVLFIHQINLDVPDWEILARILPYIQNKIELQIFAVSIEGTEEMRAFARVIQGHPAITRFRSSISFENTATLCSALATLPSLESAVLKHYQQGQRREEVPTLRSPQSITEFLRASPLRFVEFRFLCLTSSFCQAIAIALRQGASITSLELHQCSFPEGGSEKIASALKENVTLTTFQIFPVQGFLHEAFYDAMAASLLSNSTLQELVIMHEEDRCPTSVCVSSLLLALGMNKTLRKLHISGFSAVAGSLIPALRDGLEKNSTLEILELYQGGKHNEADAMESSFHIAAVDALQLNKTLKTLHLCYGTLKVTNDKPSI